MRSANILIAWLGHVIVYGLSCLLLLVVAGPFVALIVALAWGIGVAAHGFFAVAAPALRRRWTPPAPPRVMVTAAPAPWAPQPTPPTVAAASPVPASPAPSASARENRERERARSLEELSAAIAHEIRSPITAAKSLVQQVAEDPTAADSAEHARVAVAELDRVERSIAHLLRFAREEPFEPQPLELGKLIESALELVRERADSAKVRIMLDVDEIPPLVADGDQLRKVIVNLVGNALEAHAGKPAPDRFVRVSAGRNLAGDEVWIRVRDNGPGMSPQVLAKIFRPFYTTRAGSGGTGLGLSLAKKVVERHGGSIEVESALGQGTEFIVALPRAKENEP
jgi:signal transduction histidine kinase